MKKWPDFQLRRNRDLDLGSSHMEIAFENVRISNFEGLVTSTLTLARVILYTVVHRSSTSTYIPNFIEIKETFCGRKDGQMHGQTFETGFIRSTLSRSRPKKKFKMWFGVVRGHPEDSAI